MIGTLRLPPRIHFGYGARAQVPGLLAAHGRRVLAIVDPFLATSPLFLELLAAAREAGLEVEVQHGIEPELPASSLLALGELARRFAPDAILGVGGGSALDAAKVTALLAVVDPPLDQYYGENAVPGPVLPVVAVPTTAGTGSEVTPVAVVSDSERELKVGISSPYLIPAAAVVDPEFTLAAPAGVTAFAGIDALVHAVESYTARPLESAWDAELPVFTGRNALTAATAVEAAELLVGALPTAVASPDDRDARARLALGSLLAGLSFGPTGTHLAHALQYPIGALTHTPHGLGTGLLLPYVLDRIRSDPATAARIARLADAFGSSSTAVQPRIDDVIAGIAALQQRIGVPTTLREIGIRRTDLPRIAELGMRSARLVGIAPIEVDPTVLLELLEHAYAGRLDGGSAA